MKKDKLLIVGSFQDSSQNKIFGGIAKSCDEILISSSFSQFDIIKVDSTSFSVPPPNFITRLIYASRRLVNFLIKLNLERPSTCLIFCSDGASAIEKGIMITISKISGIPCIIFPRAGHLIVQAERNLIFKLLLKILFKSADKFLCQGENWKKFALDTLKIKYNKVEIVSNWTATEKLLEVGSEREIVSKNELQIIYVGWLIKEKGVMELLKSFREIVSKNHKLKLILVGDGKYKKEINQFIFKNNLSNLIEVTGWMNTNKLIEVYKNSDIFILPSWQEGMPNSLIEALATGLPSIVTSVGVIKNYFSDKEHLLLVPAKNENKLSKALEKLILDVNFRKKLSKNGYNQARSQFSSKKVLHKLSLIIKNTIN